MLATQRLSSQIVQATDDAKRAMMLGQSSTNLNGLSFFGNPNTTCTIQNAPPRSPAVLQKIATKSGWLLKRNEQHVWQSRWCCVVPHLFLYEFEGHPKLAPPNDQSAPIGILDLECYTTVRRNTEHHNDLVLELMGEESINPDLPHVNFCALTEKEGEEWSQAILNHRHAALVDEKEAYREVLDGSAQQLQVMHQELDTAHRRQQYKDGELYGVRSQLEATRRLCWQAIQATLEHDSHNTSIPAKKAYREDLESMMQNPERQQNQQDMGILEAVQVLCDYTQVLEENCQNQNETIETLQSQLDTKQQTEDEKEEELVMTMERFQKHMEEQQKNWMQQIEILQERYLEFQMEHKIVVKELEAQRMEHSMYRTASNAKITELQAHKKILKKEVLNLRRQVQDGPTLESDEEDNYRSPRRLSESLLVMGGLHDGSLRNDSFLDRNEEKKEDSGLVCGLFQ